MTNNGATRDHITSLFRSFSGQNNTLVIPRPYIDFCQGDILAALLLSQILYWEERTTDPDGWFAKSYEEWLQEIGLTEYQIKRAIKGDKRRKHDGFALQDVGVETRLMQSKFHQGAATLHYRVDRARLRTAIVAFLADLDNVQNGPQTMFRSGSEHCQERIYIDSETTSETIELGGAGAETTSEPPGESVSPPTLPEEGAQQPYTADDILTAYEQTLKKLGLLPPVDKRWLKNQRGAAARIAAAGYTPDQIRLVIAWLVGPNNPSNFYRKNPGAPRLSRIAEDLPGAVKIVCPETLPPVFLGEAHTPTREEKQAWIDELRARVESGQVPRRRQQS